MNETLERLNGEQLDKTALEYLKSYRVNNTPLDKFLKKIIDEWKVSFTYKDMLTGKRYFQNKNDINEKKRYRPTKSGGRVEDKRLNNSKESHAFMRKLTKQKSNYAFSKPFTVETEDDTYAQVLSEDYFTKAFRKMLKKVSEDSIQCGIAWVQVYYNEEGILSFKRIPADQCIPMWRDIDHTIIDGVIRIIPIKLYEDEEVIDIEEIEFYVGPYVFKYKVQDGIWEQIKDTSIKHFAVTVPKITLTEPDKEGNQEEIIQKDENGNTIYEEIELSWDRVPLVPFKYNSDEIPLINFVKELIDDYDKITSMATDVIVDIPNSIKVVKNYDGQDLGELAENLYTYRMVKVSQDGGMEALDSNFDMSPITAQLDRIRQDIYDMGQGVDSQSEETGDKSGVALKFLYSDLDLDCSGMISEFRDALEQLLFFIDVDLQIKGIGDYFEEEVDFIFNTDGIINEKEVIENIKNSADILPTEYLVKQHPWVDDATKVMDLIKKEEAEAEKKAQEVFNKNFGGGNAGADNSQNANANQNQPGGANEPAVAPAGR